MDGMDGMGVVWSLYGRGYNGSGRSCGVNGSTDRRGKGMGEREGKEGLLW